MACGSGRAASGCHVGGLLAKGPILAPAVRKGGEGGASCASALSAEMQLRRLCMVIE